MMVALLDVSGSLDGSGGETIAVVVGCERVLDVSVSWMSVGWWSGGGMVVEWWWSKITKGKEKRLSEDHSPYKSHIFPLYNGIGLTTHELTEISHLGTFMM